MMIMLQIVLILFAHRMFVFCEVEFTLLILPQLGRIMEFSYTAAPNHVLAPAFCHIAKGNLPLHSKFENFAMAKL